MQIECFVFAKVKNYQQKGVVFATLFSFFLDFLFDIEYIIVAESKKTKTGGSKMYNEKDNYDVVAQGLLEHLDTSSECFMYQLQAALSILSLEDKIRQLRETNNVVFMCSSSVK